jgi:REP element-mobilizing transposase RayT
VTLRGNHQQPVFFRDSDRDLLDRIVAESLERLAARLHAYCWMTNHLHMLVQVSDAPLGRLMLRIASTYARKVQSRLETSGHLFERRYHASLVDADSHLLAAIRYIHLNPVAAALVRDPAEYPWSSHGTYLGLQDRPWVCTDFVMRLVGTRSDTALHRYKELFNGPDQLEWGTGPLVPNRQHPQIVGDDAFVRKVLNSQPQRRSQKSLEQLVDECCRRFQVSRDLLVSPGRGSTLVSARAWLGHQASSEQAATISAVARLLGRTEGALRHIMRRYPPPIAGY